MQLRISSVWSHLVCKVSHRTLEALNAIILKIILTILILVSLPATAYAQEPNIKFEHITVDQGLSQSSGLCILQDSKGFMWFGTQDGLNKYDGYKYISYKYNELDSHSLSDNWITSIYEDKSGAIWVGTDGGGLNKFDQETEQFTHYIHDINNPSSLGANRVLSIYEDQSGGLWIGTNGGGLNQFNQETRQFTHYTHDPDDSKSLSNDTVLSIYEDQSGGLWIGTDGGGLNQFNRETRQFTHYTHDPDKPDSLGYNTVSSIVEDRFGNFWLGTSSWYGNAYGTALEKFDPELGQFTHYTHDPNDPNSLSENIVPSIWKDNSEILWIGTGFSGINKLDTKNHKFTTYKHKPTNLSSLSDDHVSSIYEDRNGTLWIGTFNGGLDKLDRKTGKFTHYTHDPNSPNSLSSNAVWSVYEDHLGNLWIGTFGSGLDKFDRATEQFTHYTHNPNNPNSLSDNTIASIYEDHLGNLWIGTFRGGLNKLERETGRFIHYKYDPDNRNSLSDNLVWSIYEDQFGTLWVGGYGQGGLNKLNRETKQFTRYKHESSNPNSLSYDRINAIYEYPADTLWIGTYGGGLEKFDIATETFTHYTDKDGLPNNSVVGILADDEGNLWLSTGKGLSKFNPKSETFRNYDVSDGLQGNEFDGVKAYFKSKTGEMFFGGLNGFNAFYPEQVKDNPHIPPIVLTDFGKFDGSVKLDTAISETKEIKLSYKDRFFWFEFAALDYTNPSKNQYAYKLEGFDKDWIYSGTRRYASYTNLDGGTYTFRVKGSNNDGVWNEEGTSLKIIITPPPWKTWWAYTLYAVALVSAVLGYVQWRTRAQAKENALLRESERKLHQFLEAIPLGIKVIDTAGKFVYFNQTALKLYGRETSSDASLEQCSDVYPQLYIAGTKQQYPLEDLPLIRALKGEKSTIDDLVIHQTNRVVPIEVWGTPVYDEQGTIIYAVAAFQDITERKLAEAALLASLREKEVLLKEVHHRVKNNLQIISSLLDLQSEYIQERQLLEMFRSSQNRIRSMALIHEELYQSKVFDQVDLTHYIRQLTTYLLQTYAIAPENIILKLNLDEISSNLDTAIPCGLILNELISNALKHALNGEKKGMIWIELKSEGNQINLVVGNDEPSFPKFLDFSSKKSLGLQLVEVLVRQLEGQIEIKQSQGTVFKISFSNLLN
jgi:PAS domain S-box-containing protein